MPAIARNRQYYAGGADSATALEYDNTSSGLTATNTQDAIDEVNDKEDNRNKVTTFAVAITGWTSTTSAQSGSTLYKKSIAINNDHTKPNGTPTIDIGCASGSTLPTVAEQNSYNLLQYVTVDDAVPCLYLYASAIPTTAFYIKVRGCD